MGLFRFVPIRLTLFLVCGILTASFFDLGLLFSIGATVLSIALLLFFFVLKKANPIWFYMGTALTTFCLGILAYSMGQPKNWADHYANHERESATVWELRITEAQKPSAFSEQYIAEVIKVDGTARTGPILLKFPPNSFTKPLMVDDRVLVAAKTDPIPPALNPHTFDYRNYMARKGILHQLRPKAGAFVWHPPQHRTLLGRANAVRDKLAESLERAAFGPDELSIAKALLLGQRNTISENTYDSYKKAGAVHILAVSGLHVGILLLLIQSLLRPLRRLPHGDKLQLVLAIVLLWGFAFLAGLSASVVRAVTMFSFMAYALFLNRPSNAFNILALSMLFILLVIDANLLFQAGFQMSYAAVGAIVWLYPKLMRWWAPKNPILMKIWQLLSVSIVAQLGVLPISLFYFHQFPGLFFISNLLIVPFLGIVLGMGLVVMFLSLLDFLPSFLASIYNQMIAMMNGTVTWVAAQESFLFTNISFNSVQLVLSYVLLHLVFGYFPVRFFKRMALILTTLLLLQLATVYPVLKHRKKEQLLLGHVPRKTVLLHREGQRLYQLSPEGNNTERITEAYALGENIPTIQNRPLKETLMWQGKSILVIDSLGVYLPFQKEIDYVILTQSPKLNLERLIDSLSPKVIIADGSNYTNAIALWKGTCQAKKVPFHSTREKGAYSFP
ncbi:ComEC/Rec2 family competence protein [Maribacter sp. 2-571]|uniref:ComEC/Rec2 family competence protein n=1 Tax=Maribacter sp. 2-571 TaxID=3417569 RepID=UPI003D3590F2